MQINPSSAFCHFILLLLRFGTIAVMAITEIFKNTCLGCLWGIESAERSCAAVFSCMEAGPVLTQRQRNMEEMVILSVRSKILEKKVGFYMLCGTVVPLL